ncbi:phage tail assembly protein [Rhizobium laguerreae]|uniref:phage tail assembly protein n=1 Tax=Rhizobium laguerreae TaxID=1076926 RepID=UPI001C906D0D|nr:phage tail assembly protein [Rhizobium laguerreae]MBY3434816.1 phage tail assembly protein [Rhizobium laguerreae]MBY3448959.1 phage tail assembly protein [Rhizobium laguerreae]MBY3456733.1 phage tail assembly protein [Rhizobium laguerreae]
MTTITLSAPVEHSGKAYSELTFREATIGDLIMGDAVTGELTKTMAVLASISDVPLPAFKKIKARDLNAIMKATADLLGNEPSTIGD